MIFQSNSYFNERHLYRGKSIGINITNKKKNVTSSTRFFQESIHEEKGFASMFCIHIISESRPYKYYNYFDFFQFFEFYRIHKWPGCRARILRLPFWGLHGDIIFTTTEKFNDVEGKYKGVTRLFYCQTGWAKNYPGH